jgi:hypothetical protein
MKVLVALATLALDVPALDAAFDPDQPVCRKGFRKS